MRRWGYDDDLSKYELTRGWYRKRGDERIPRQFLGLFRDPDEGLLGSGVWQPPGLVLIPHPIVMKRVQRAEGHLGDRVYFSGRDRFYWVPPPLMPETSTIA